MCVCVYDQYICALTFNSGFVTDSFYDDKNFGHKSTCERPVTPTPEGAIRLMDPTHSVDNGRLEVFLDGVWGTVCGRNFGINEADVVCGQLGFSAALRQGMVLDSSFYRWVWLDIEEVSLAKLIYTCMWFDEAMHTCH